MKTMKLLFTLLFGAAFSIVGFGQISGTGHDFSGETWNASGEICIACHTPHNALATGPVLWNRVQTTATFTPYASGSLEATVGQPDGPSKLCLGCHDGTVGLEDFGGTTGGTSYITGDALVGIDLSNDHPVSFTYDAALATADGELFDPSSANSGLGSTIAADLLSNGTTMECSSCHDVHNGGLGTSYLLRIDNAASALCLTCHDK